MTADIASNIRPIAEPRVLDDIYTADQYRRLVEVVRREGPWQEGRRSRVPVDALRPERR